MTKARTAFAVAIVLALALPLTVAAQSEAPPAQPQGQMGQMGGHQHMGRMGGPPSPEQRLERLSTMLNLTDDQKAKIKPVLEEQSTAMQNLRKDTSMSPQDRHNKMREIHDNTSSQIRAVLTSEQQAKLDSMKKQGYGRGRGMSPGMGQGQGMGQGMGTQSNTQQKPPQQ